MSDSARRFFWGHSLAQAVVSAARWYGLAPERLAYRVHEKRHGFVRMRRPVLIEVDPEAVERPADAVPPAATAAPAPRPKQVSASGSASPRLAVSGSLPEGASGPRSARLERATEGKAPDTPTRPSRPRRVPRPRRERPDSESWSAPDGESEHAALEAAGRLLRLAGLELEVRVQRGEERLGVELSGADESRLEQLGVRFLDDLDHLLPRAIHGLCGRLVRTRVEGVGLRAAREAELRARAREIAERVLSGGDEELSEPLDPAERRFVHLELADDKELVTESVGDGLRKRVRISRAS